MEQIENKTVECILRIQNPDFTKDIKVDINEKLILDDSWDLGSIYNGASQTLLQKYLPQMKVKNTTISLLTPTNIAQDSFIKFMEEADINKAQSDILTILNNLPKEKREKVLKNIQVI